MFSRSAEGLRYEVGSTVCLASWLAKTDRIKQRNNLRGYRNNTIDSGTVSDCVEAVSVCACDGETHGSGCCISLIT